MKKLIIPILLLLVSNSIMAQIPGFEKVSEWKFGQVNIIEGRGNQIIFNSGSYLISGDISNPDTLVETGLMDLNQIPKVSLLKDNRLFLAGFELIILDISDWNSPKIQSRIPLEGYPNKIMAFGTVLYIGFSTSITIVDISNPEKPILGQSIQISYGSDLTVLDKKLCIGDFYFSEVRVADLSDPLNPFWEDTLKIKSFKLLNIANLGNSLLIPESSKLSIWKLNEAGRFVFTDSVLVNENADHIIVRDSVIGFFSWRIPGIFLKLFDVKNLKNPISINSVEIPSNGGQFYINSKSLLSLDGIGGLSLYKYEPAKEPVLKFSSYESSPMENPVLKGNQLFVPESFGIKYFELDEHFNPVLKRHEYLGFSDYWSGKGMHLAGYQDYLYAQDGTGVTILTRFQSDLRKKWIYLGMDYISKLATEDSWLVVSGSAGGYPNEKNYQLYLMDISNPFFPSEKYSFKSKAEINDFLIDQNRIFVSYPDSGVFVYKFPFEYPGVEQLGQVFAKNDNPLRIASKDGFAAVGSDSTVEIFKEVATNVFLPAAEIKVKKTGEWWTSPQIPVFSKNFLLIYSKYNSVQIYDITDPFKPVFAGLFENGIRVADISVDGDLLIATKVSNGFTIYKYKSVPDGVEETPESVPLAFSLKPNYPNPFNPETRIPFTLPGKGKVTFKTYSVLGQLVKEETLDANPGLNSWLVNLENQSSGIYLVKGTYQNRTETVKILLVK